MSSVHHGRFVVFALVGSTGSAPDSARRHGQRPCMSLRCSVHPAFFCFTDGPTVELFASSQRLGWTTSHANTTITSRTLSAQIRCLMRPPAAGSREIAGRRTWRPRQPRGRVAPRTFDQTSARKTLVWSNIAPRTCAASFYVLNGILMEHVCGLYHALEQTLTIPFHHEVVQNPKSPLQDPLWTTDVQSGSSLPRVMATSDVSTYLQGAMISCCGSDMPPGTHPLARFKSTRRESVFLLFAENFTWPRSSVSGNEFYL